MPYSGLIVALDSVQFCNVLNSGSSYVCFPAGYMSVAPEYSVGSELDIGWQFVVDPKPKSGNSIASEITKSDKHPEANDATLSDEECDAVVVARETTCESNMTQNIMSKNEKGLVDVISNPTLGSREKTLKKVESMVSKQSGDGLLAPIKTAARTSPTKMGHSWRTADKEALAALVAQKTAEKLENCDLPAPRSESVCKTPLESWEMMVESPSQISQSLDRELLASIFQGGEPSRFESSALPTSPLLYSAPESHSTPSLPAKVSEPLNISSGPANATTHRLSHSYRYFVSTQMGFCCFFRSWMVIATGLIHLRNERNSQNVSPCVKNCVFELQL